MWNKDGVGIADGPHADPYHISPQDKDIKRGYLMPLAMPEPTFKEEWEKSPIRRFMTNLHSSVEFQSVIFALVLLEAALVTASFISGANNTFPSSHTEIISSLVLWLLVFDLVITLLGRGFQALKSPRFYFDFFIVALALTMTYLPTSAFDSIESTYGIKAASIVVSVRLSARFLRFALLIRVLVVSVLYPPKGQEEEIDEEEEANRALEEKRMKGNLPTPNLTAFQVVKWTLRYMFRFEFVMTMRMLLEVLIIAGCSSAQPWLLSDVFDKHIPNKDYARCTYGIVGVVATMMLKAQMNYRLGNDNPSGGSFIPLMTKNLTRKAIRLPWHIYSSMHSDFLLNSLGQDMVLANNNLDLVVNGLASFLDLVAVLLTMAIFSYQMTIVIALSLPIVIMYNKKKAGEVSVWNDRLVETRKRQETHVQEIMQHVQHVKLLGIGPKMWRKLLSITDAFSVNFDTYDEKQFANIRGLAFLAMFTTVITIAFGTVQVILDQLTIGQLIGFLQLAGGIDAPIESLTNCLLGIASSKPALNHIIGLMEAPEENPGKAPPKAGKLCLDNVSYKFTVDEYIHPMGPYNLTLEEGETCAIVGASGCGKSTMMKLLAGLYTPSDGSVTLDGVPMSEYDTTRLIAWMEQDCILLTGTLRENLVAGSQRRIPEAELLRACELARFDWGNLSHGLDTYLGQNGGSLSSGDRQRIAAARTLLLRRPLVVLDEPTSAQDPATKGPVMAMLLNCEWDPAPGLKPRKSTVLAVTHSIQNAKQFQKICVVSQGSVVEFGETERLLSLNGHFAQMVRNLTGIAVLPSGAATITTERLMDLWIFSRVPDSNMLLDFTLAFLSKQLRAEEVAAESGDPADSALIVARGALGVHDRAGNLVRTYEVGEMAGGINLHGKEIRKWGFTLTALRPTTLLVLRKEAFEAELEKSDTSVRGAVAEMQAAMASAVHPTTLRRAWPFATVPSSSLDQLVSLLEVGCFPEKKRLFNYPKDPPRCAMIVVHGDVAVRYRNPQYGEFVQHIGPRSTCAVSAAFSRGAEGTGYAGVAPKTSKGDVLSGITTAPTVVLMADHKVIAAGGNELYEIAERTPMTKYMRRALEEDGMDADVAPRAPENTPSLWGSSKVQSIGSARDGTRSFRTVRAAVTLREVEERALEAHRALAKQPRVFVEKLVADVKRAASPESLARHWLLSPFPRETLRAVSSTLSVNAVEEGQELAGAYGWGADAGILVSGCAVALAPDPNGGDDVESALGPGDAFNLEALFNDATKSHDAAFGGPIADVAPGATLVETRRVTVSGGGCVVLRVERRAFLNATANDDARRGLAAACALRRLAYEWISPDGARRAGLLPPEHDSTPEDTTRTLRAIAAATKTATAPSREEGSLDVGELFDVAAPGFGKSVKSGLENQSTRRGTVIILSGEGDAYPPAPPPPPPSDAADDDGDEAASNGAESPPRASRDGAESPQRRGSRDGAESPQRRGSRDGVEAPQRRGSRDGERGSTKTKSTLKAASKSKRTGSKAKIAAGGTSSAPVSALKDRAEPEPPPRPTRSVRAGDVLELDGSPESTVGALRRRGGDGVPLVALFVPLVAGEKGGFASLVLARDETKTRLAKEASSRETRMKKVRDVRRQTADAEVSLGLRKRRSPRANWLVGVRRWRALAALGGDDETTVYAAGPDSGSCTLDEQLDMHNSILSQVAASIRPREELLAALLRRWHAGGPVRFDPSMEPAAGEPETDAPHLGPGAGADAESAGAFADEENGDLSIKRLNGLEDAIFERETQRTRRLRSYVVTLRGVASSPVVARDARVADDARLAVESAEETAKILDDAIAERRHLRDAFAVIPRKVFEEKPELRPLFDVRLDVTAKAATRRETERCVRVAGAFLAVARAAERARAFLVPIADAAEAKIRALMEELEMGTNGPQDPFREEGGTLRSGGDGGRVERRQLALDAELGQLERSAALVRAAVGRLEADRERVMREYEAKVRFENQEDMRRLEEEMRRAFKRADESYALGARNASRLENWKAAPFARNIMSSFRFTLGVKRQFESLVDDLVLEVAEEAFPDAVRETSDEVNAAVDALFASETEATRDAFNRRPTEEGVRDNPLFDDEDDWDDARTPRLSSASARDDARERERDDDTVSTSSIVVSEVGTSDVSSVSDSDLDDDPGEGGMEGLPPMPSEGGLPPGPEEGLPPL